MFSKRDSQLSLFEAHFMLPDNLVKSLELSWAHIFRKEVLPMINEEEFSSLYHSKWGRPNVAVVLLVALSILKELFNLSDKSLMGQFEFDLRFRYALRLPLESSTFSVRTLYNFRKNVVGNPALANVFNETARRIIEILSINTELQRMDSTHVLANMASLTRLGLFVKTIEGFLHKLRRSFPSLYASLPPEFEHRYLERPGQFADASSSESQRRLDLVAEDLFLLINHFKDDEEIKKMNRYNLLERLLQEQCLIKSENGVRQVHLKPNKEIASDTLQSPSDPDATFSGHKGQGYQAQVAETCHPENPIQVITHIKLEQAHESDQNATIPVIENLQKEQMGPEELLADTNYNSGKNLLDAAELGVQLTAPMPGSPTPGNLSLADFHIDLEEMKVDSCPEGHLPICANLGQNGSTLNLRFDSSRCSSCDVRSECPAGRHKGRVSVSPEDIAVAVGHCIGETTEFKEKYKKRSGIEGTNAELKKAHGLGKLWCRGLLRGSFSVIMKATACNVKRFMTYRCAQISNSTEFAYV